MGEVCDGHDCWIGLTDQHWEGDWEWDRHGDQGWRNWSSGEPNNMGGNEESCVMIHGEHDEWKNFSCEEHEARPLCYTFGETVVYNGSYYVQKDYHRGSDYMNWWDAEDFCESQ